MTQINNEGMWFNICFAQTMESHIIKCCLLFSIRNSHMAVSSRLPFFHLSLSNNVFHVNVNEKWNWTIMIIIVIIICALSTCLQGLWSHQLWYFNSLKLLSLWLFPSTIHILWISQFVMFKYLHLIHRSMSYQFAILTVNSRDYFYNWVYTSNKTHTHTLNI